MKIWVERERDRVDLGKSVRYRFGIGDLGSGYLLGR